MTSASHHSGTPPRGAPRRAFRGTAGRDRGAAIIEAALVTPLFFMMVLGLIDGSYALFGDHVVRGAAASGGRAASALANDPDADFRVLDAVRRDVSGIGDNALVRVVVYRAHAFGDPPSASCRNGTPSSGANPCNVYQGEDLDLEPDPETYDYCSESSPDRHWCPIDRETTLNVRVNPKQYPDYIGVWVLVRHKPIVGLIIPSERMISHQSVLRIEPRTYE